MAKLTPFLYLLLLAMVSFGQDHKKCTKPPHLNELDYSEKTSPIGGMDDFFSWVINKEGEVFTRGSNDQGQLGRGDIFKADYHEEYQKVGGELSEKKVTMMASGDWYNLALTSDNRVYAWGKAIWKRAAELKNEVQQNTPEMVSIDGKKVIKVAAGDNFGLALTDEGELYSFGRNAAGQLGRGSTDGRVSKPRRMTVPFKKIEITDMAAGQNHGVALSEAGKVYLWGDTCECLTDAGFKEEFTLTPKEVVLEGHRITAIASGWEHVLALDKHGYVWVFGENDTGQLGLGDKKGRTKPERLLKKRFGGEKIVAIGAAGYASFVLSKKGNVFNWWGSCHRKDQECRPKKLDFPTRVERISVGPCHLIAVNKEGKKYFWGLMPEGLLGNDTVLSIREPILITDHGNE